MGYNEAEKSLRLVFVKEKEKEVIERKGSYNMVRSTAREIAIRLSYELSFTDLDAHELLNRTLTDEHFAGLAAEEEAGAIYS